MYIVLADGKAQNYDGKILAFCAYNPTIFSTKRSAQEAIDKTFHLTQKASYDKAQSIYVSGYEIKQLQII